MSDLEEQLAAYTRFLEERSLDRAADHTTLVTAIGAATDDIEAGDVIVMELKDKQADGKTPVSALRRRAPLVISAAAAAVILLVIGVLGFDDEGADRTDPAIEQDDAVTTTVPSEPQPSVGNDEVETIDLGEVITSAIREGSSADVEAIYSPDVIGVFEGVELAPEIARPILTDVSMRDLVRATTSECGEWRENGTVTCRFHHEFAFLDDITELHSGSVTFTLVDGVVTRYEQLHDDFDATIDALAGYRSWVLAVHPDTGATLFNRAGMSNGGPVAATLHAEYAAEYNATLALLGGSADLGSAITAAVAAGDGAVVRGWYAEDAVTVLEGVEVPAPLGTAIVTDVTMRELMVASTSDCSPMRVDGVVTCRVHLDFEMLDDVGVHSGAVAFTLAEGVIVRHEQVGDDFAAMTAELAGYREWVATNHPGDLDTLFSEAGMVLSGDTAAPLHAERSAAYNASQVD